LSRIALLSFSDGRDFVHRDVAAFVAEAEARVASALVELGHEVVAAGDPITSPEEAVAAARRAAAAQPDLTVFHYAVWSFPHFSVAAARATAGPLALVSNIDPKFPGMVALLGAGGSLDQIGRRHQRIAGDVADPAVGGRLGRLVRAATAVRALEGTTFGRIGGRSMGMYTAVGRTDEWMTKFGIDVEEIDQWEVVRRADAVEASRAREGREWIERHAAGVHYDGSRLTPELLERQVRSYHAVRELIDEWGLAFSGIKGQPELTNHFATTDVAEAFLNDPYDWEGAKAPHVCATEVDMDGALTMQLMHLITGTPSMLADVRHYFADRDRWDLVNSGQHPTWWAARSDDPAENLSRTNFYPADFYFPAGGASVHHLAAAGEMTFARLSRRDGRYRLQLTGGEFETYDEATNLELMNQSSPHWPHAFARFDAPAEVLLERFGANHIHVAPGDIAGELELVAGMLDIDVDRLGSA
jgi:L-fucose/D-arabinose isomerase